MKKTNETALIRSRALALLFSLVAAALIMLPVIASAKGGDKARTPGKVYMQPLSKAAHATVTIADFGDGRYTLSVESKSGNDIYYNEILKSPEKFSKIFDFSRLHDGEYTLKVKIKGKTSVRHFTIEDGKINVHYKEKAEPVFNKIGQKAILFVPNETGETYTIKVLSPKGEELYFTLASNDTIKKMFDFSETEAGEYTVMASSENNQYSYNFQNK